jgi:hypothetical protein
MRRVFSKENKHQRRGQIFKTIHDGFDLTFVDGLRPPEVREEMAQSRRQFADFYTMIGHSSHRPLRLLLAPTPV